MTPAKFGPDVVEAIKAAVVNLPKKPYWLPRSCPSCQAILSPAEPPKPGDLARCNLCGELLKFDRELVLQPIEEPAPIEPDGAA